MVGGGLVGLAYYITQIFLLRESFLDRGPPQWPLLIVGLLMGIIGSTVDSLLGATFQYSGDFLLRYYFTMKFTKQKKYFFWFRLCKICSKINCKLFWSYLSWNKRFPLIKLWIHLMNYTYIFFLKIKFITSMLNFLQF